MLKLVLTAILMSAPAASANDNFIICESPALSLKVSRKLTFVASKNGWQTFWGRVAYRVTAGEKTLQGTLDAQIMSRDDSRPGYRIFDVALLDAEEAALRRQGTEGGMTGFASLDIREKLMGRVPAKFRLRRPWPELPEFSDYEIDFQCDVAAR
ncbi:MAG TPA: hypothetical protein VFV50_05100 [Bdellovibrionales bacterium]|nr:hypothetical protein [Bdellovibrionales bacterium]